MRRAIGIREMGVRVSGRGGNAFRTLLFPAKFGDGFREPRACLGVDLPVRAELALGWCWAKVEPQISDQTQALKHSGRGGRHGAETRDRPDAIPLTTRNRLSRWSGKISMRGQDKVLPGLADGRSPFLTLPQADEGSISGCRPSSRGLPARSIHSCQRLSVSMTPR